MISPVSVFTDVVSQDLTVRVFTRYAQAGHLRILELAHVPRRDTTTLFDDYRIADADLERGGLTAQTLRHELQRDFITADEERVGLEERGQDLGLVHAEGRAG